MIRLIIIALLIFRFSDVSGSRPTDAITRVEEVDRVIREHMERRSSLIEKEHYDEAVQSTGQIINELDKLVEAFMPLDERIKMLISREQEIIEQTRKVSNVRDGAEGEPKRSSLQKDLIHNQIVNREKTEQTYQLIEQNIKRPDTPADAKTEVRDQNPADQMQEISKLIEAAAIDQTNAIAKLELQKNRSAIEDEEAAVEKMEKALEKLRQQNRSDQQNQTGQKNPGDDKRDDKNQQPQQQSQNKGSDGQQQKKDNQAGADSKKLTPEKALKELLKLRKQAADEKTRRKMEYGGTVIQDRTPVEKDW